MEQALALARKQSPELRAARAQAQAAGQDIRAAGLWHNPELGFEAENVGGDNLGKNRGEYTLGISQEFPLSGRIGKAKDVARYGLNAAEQTIQLTEREFDAMVRSEFTRVLALQEISKVRKAQEVLARGFSETATKRYEAGGASELDTLQADSRYEEAQLATIAIEKQLEGALKSLASLLGVPFSDLGHPTGDFYHQLDDAQTVSIGTSYPALQRFQSLEEQARAEAKLARTQSIPDLTLGAGVRYQAEGDVQSFVVGASIPLPFVKRGKYESASSMLRADALSAERERLQRDLQQDLTRVMVMYESASIQASRYRDKLLPQAAKGYELSRDGYAAGRYSALEVIIAQQHLTETNIRYIESLLEARLALAEMTKYISE
ncbi:TolC family protein [Pontiellaceae bacterium B12219]|nr:TolC family protein [Pontiellaceae bacterium B12219]